MTRPDSPGARSREPVAPHTPERRPPASEGSASAGAEEIDRSRRALGTAEEARRRPSLGRVVVVCAVIAAGLHTLAVIWTWAAWSPGARGSWLVWLDLPVSLGYLDRVGSALLPWSLVVGGLQWAAIGALLAWSLGYAVRRRRRPEAGPRP